MAVNGEIVMTQSRRILKGPPLNWLQLLQTSVESVEERKELLCDGAYLRVLTAPVKALAAEQ